MRKKGLLFVAILPLLVYCKSNPKEYKITWVNYNDSILYTHNVKENEVPQYQKSTPLKPKSHDYTYKFKEWDPTPYAANKDQIYKATYREIENYDVIWHVNDEKTVTDRVDIESIESDKVTYSGVVPSKSNSGQTYYYFNGWTKDINKGSKVANYYTVFKECSKDDDQDNDGLPDYLDPQPLSNEFDSTGYYKFGEDEVTLNNQKFKMDYQNMFLSNNADNYTFSKNIAKLAAALSLDKYNSDYGTLTINENITPVNKYERILERLGCDEINTVTLNGDDYITDKNDLTSYVLAKKTIKDKETNLDRDFVFAIFKQHNPNVYLWESDFDVGYNGQVYYDLVGSNHEKCWKEDAPEYHKGFYIAAYRAFYNEVNGLKNYLKTLNNPVLFLTGYSRGAAISNIISNFINNDSELNNIKLFTYTFATPKVYFGPEDDNVKNKNIFNILNKDDVVQEVPFTFWDDDNNENSKRYGVDITLKMSDNQQKYIDRTGTKYDYVSNATGILEKKLTMKRKFLYEFMDSGMKTKFYTLEELNAQIEKYRAIIKKAGLTDEESNKYFRFYYVEDGGVYYLKFDFRMASVMKVMERLLINKGEITDYLEVFNMFEYFKTMLEELAVAGLTSSAAIAIPHFITTYSILVSNI